MSSGRGTGTGAGGGGFLLLFAPPEKHQAVLEALGYEPSFDWHAPLPARKRPWAIVRAWSNVVWTLRFLAPWLKRRALGTSSGDGMTAKRPELAPVQWGWITDVPAGAAGELLTG